MTDNTGQKPSQGKGSRKEFTRLLGVASTVGINFVISTFIGFGIGWVLDNKVFNTSPYLTIIFLILGIVAGFKYLFRIALKTSRENQDSSGQGDKDSSEKT